MAKPKIFATGNEQIKGEFTVSYYIIEKDKNFLNWLDNLLKDILEIKNKQAKVITRENGENYEIYSKEIEKMIDIHEYYENGKDRIDVFYGKSRIYLTFRKSEETRRKFGDFIYKTKDWIEVTEKKEIPQYVKRIK